MHKQVTTTASLYHTMRHATRIFVQSRGKPLLLTRCLPQSAFNLSMPIDDDGSFGQDQYARRAT